MASTGSSTTIQKLKDAPIPPSPTKWKKTLKCAVLSKSPLRPTKSGDDMFSLILSDGDPESTIRAVCLDETIYTQLQTNQTYDLQDFKLKKAFKSQDSKEIQIDDFTRIHPSPQAFELKNHNFTISKILRGDATGQRAICLKAKVIEVENTQLVGTYPNTKTKRQVYIADNTGHITLSLWRERATDFNFTTDDVLELKNLTVHQFNKQITLTTTLETDINKIQEDMEVTLPKKRLPKSNVVNLESPVMAIKEFQISYKCLGCHQDLDISSDDCQTIKCPTCSCIFLKLNNQQLNNHCKVLLNNTWYSANTSVIQHLFDWTEPKQEPTEPDILKLLNNNYSFRIDMNRNVIEHAIIMNVEDYGIDEEEMETPMHKKMKTQ